MAERRMFAKTIIDSDCFLDMPLTAQALYFHLAMRADDDGFVNNPKRILRTIGASDKNFKLLISKQFIIQFDSGAIVIKHWRVHNQIRKDRYKRTVNLDEKNLLAVDKNGTYNRVDTDDIQNGYDLETERQPLANQLETQYRLDKSSLDKSSLDIFTASDEAEKTNTKKFKPPTLEEVQQYCLERNNNIDPQRFVDYYTSNGWMVGRAKMRDWKASVRTWEQNEKKVFNKYSPVNIENESPQSDGMDWDHLPGVTILT